MKKITCTILCITLVLCSCSFVFADDITQTQISGLVTQLVNSASIRNSSLSQIYSILNSGLAQIRNNLETDNSSVADMFSELLNNGIPLDLSFKFTGYQTLVPKRSISNPSMFSSASSVSITNTLPVQYTGSSSDASLLLTYGNQVLPESLGDWFNVLNSNIGQLVMRTYTPNTHYYAYGYDYSDYSLSQYNAYSIADLLAINFHGLQNSLGRLSAFFVDEEELQAKKDNAEVIESVLSDFVNPAGDTSVSLNNISDVSGSLSSLKSGISSSADISSAFEVFDDGSDSWGWFSQDVADSLDTVVDVEDDLPSNGLMLFMSAPASDTPYLDEYMRSVLGGINAD